MSQLSNLLVVSDLHFGEELLPGATPDRRHAVELAATAFREFVRYHTARRRDGRPWRLVIAGDMFDFMSVVVAGTPDLPARTKDERKHGLQRSVASGVLRMRAIGEAHRAVFADLVRFAAAGHTVDLVVGNHDIELLAQPVVDELRVQLRAAGATARELDRIHVVPWFVHVPGVAWIEHGHAYDEACSYEFNLSPFDPADGRLVYNADHAAMRYLSAALPDVDPHAVEEWSFWGFLQFAWDSGLGQFRNIIGAYSRFVTSLIAARTLHQSPRRRHRRRREHRERIARVAGDANLPIDTVRAVDRLARAPLTVSWHRLGRVLMLDRFSVVIGLLVILLALLVALPLFWAVLGGAVAFGVAGFLQHWLGAHNVTSQLPMRSVPRRLAKLVDAPVIVFGHTHDPRWQQIDDRVVYVNSGTWLPAARPGLRKSFTHVMIQPIVGAAPLVELRQWRDGASQPYAFVDEASAPVIRVGERALAG